MARLSQWALPLLMLAGIGEAAAQQGIPTGAGAGRQASQQAVSRTEPWSLFTSASVFSSLEATNARQIDDLQDGENITQQVTENTQTLSGYAALAAVGLSWITPRSDTIAAYTVGAQVSGDLVLDPEDVLQAVLLQSRYTPTSRWLLNLQGNVFWGVFRSEQDLIIGGFDPTSGIGQTPDTPQVDPGVDPGSTPQPQQPQQGQTDFTNPNTPQARIISVVRYLRHSEGINATYQLSPRARVGGQLNVDSQIFLDRDLIRAYDLSLFDAQAFTGGLFGEYALNPRTRLGLTGRAGRSWFIPISTVNEDQGSGRTATQSLLLQGAVQHQLTPRWQTGGEIGVNVLYPVDEPDQQQLGMLARGQLSYLWRQWRYQLLGQRTIQRSELGAVFDNIGFNLSVIGQFIDRSRVNITAGYIRQQPLLVVALPGESPEEARARGEGSLTSDNFQGVASYQLQLTNQMVLSLAYNYNHRLSGPDREDQQISHRFLMGLTISYPGARQPGAQ